jgi:hypothetical protein
VIYLYKYNEEVNWSKSIRRLVKGYNKSDMYITEVFPDAKTDSIPDELLFYGYYMSESDMDNKNYNNIYIDSKYIEDSNKGVFGYKYHYIYAGKDYTFGKPKYWYDQSNIFVKLKTISDKLGYKINKTVKTNKGNSGKIEDIVEFSFYYLEKGGCKEILTLLYKVGKIYYQIKQIELLDDNNGDNLIDETIKENFYELLDTDIITYLSIESDVNVYECKLIINKFSTAILYEVIEHLYVADNRLKDLGISTEIQNIYKKDSKYNIDFICKKR